MSTPTANIAQVLQAEANAAGPQATRAEERKPTTRPYKARMATKVKWALGDIMEASDDAERRMDNLLVWMDEARAMAEAGEDTAWLALLGKFSHEMNHLERDISKIVRGGIQAIAEAKPQVEEKKKYSEL